MLQTDVYGEYINMQFCLSALNSESLVRALPILLITAVIFLNGATDAPNTVAGAVSCGCLSYRRAALLCAVFNFLGMTVSCMFFPAVAKSVSELTAYGKVSVTAALASVTVFTAVAWIFGIPTSESHALIAALGGAQLYFSGKTSSAFIGISLKSLMSCAVGAVLGAVFCIVSGTLKGRLNIILGKPCLSEGRGGSQTEAVQERTESVLAAVSSACHGMQDGQKFAAMTAALAMGRSAVTGSDLPFSVILLCSCIMAAGSLCGGKRMIKKLGQELIKSERCDVIPADAAAAFSTLISTFFGIPVSTTYMKTCSMLGSAAACGKKADKRVAAELFLTWIMTYPVCMLLSYIFCAVIH